MFIDRPRLNHDLGWYEQEFGVSSGDEPVDRVAFRIDRTCRWSLTSVDTEATEVVNRFGEEQLGKLLADVDAKNLINDQQRLRDQALVLFEKRMTGDQHTAAQNSKRNEIATNANKLRRAYRLEKSALSHKQLAQKKSYQKAVRTAVRLDLWGLPYKFPSCSEFDIGGDSAIEICESEGKSVRKEYSIKDWPYVTKEYVTRQVAFTRSHLQFLLGRCDAPSSSNFGVDRRESMNIVKRCGELIKTPSPWHPPESD